MGDAKSIKERGILEQVIKSELDFITYVDVHTGAFHVIVTNDDTDVTPPPEGDYTQVNAQMIPLYVHPKDREACRIFSRNWNRGMIWLFRTACCAGRYTAEKNCIFLISRMTVTRWFWCVGT